MVRGEGCPCHHPSFTGGDAEARRQKHAPGLAKAGRREEGPGPVLPAAPSRSVLGALGALGSVCRGTSPGANEPCRDVCRWGLRSNHFSKVYLLYLK